MGLIVGTAGHIDHGKSTIVQHLTGTDPDRLKDEKERGITIELGYAFMPLADGGVLSFIDVPGHERFVRQMVAGIATVDLFMLVVAADEGVMPQTREHLDVLRLLEVDRGLVVLAKCDLVDVEMQDLVESEVRELLRGTPAEDARILRVSAVTGQGMDELRGELERTAAGVPLRSPSGSFRLAIDRVFVLKGFGTIVGGTALSGMVRIGDNLELQPGGKTYRVREMRINEGRSTDQGSAGDRIALNMVGLEKEDVSRGYVLATPGYVEPFDSLDASCTMLPGEIELSNRMRVRFHTGTSEVMARAFPAEGQTLAPGGTGFVHFQLEGPVVALPGDRFVIRRYSPIVTIGGGKILETGTSKIRRRQKERRLERLEKLSRIDPENVLRLKVDENPIQGITVEQVAAEFGLAASELQKARDSLHRAGEIESVRDGSVERLIPAQTMERVRTELRAALEKYHGNKPLSVGVPTGALPSLLEGSYPSWLLRSVVAGMEKAGGIRRGKEHVALSDHPRELPPDEASRAEEMLAEVEALGFEGSESRSVPGEGLLEAMLEREMLRSLGEGLVASDATVRKARSLIQESFGKDGFRLAELRDVLGTSRKKALLWAELLDSLGITVRKGDLRYLTDR
jgi:selenocysteine-specific elongation factor